jgi:hypothetical protein
MVVIQSSADFCGAAIVATGARATSKTDNFILAREVARLRLTELIG